MILIPTTIRKPNTIHTNPTNIENSGNPKCPSIIHRIKAIGYTKTSFQFIHSFRGNSYTMIKTPNTIKTTHFLQIQSFLLILLLSR